MKKTLFLVLQPQYYILTIWHKNTRWIDLVWQSTVPPKIKIFMNFDFFMSIILHGKWLMLKKIFFSRFFESLAFKQKNNEQKRHSIHNATMGTDCMLFGCAFPGSFNHFCFIVFRLCKSKRSHSLIQTFINIWKQRYIQIVENVCVCF